MTDGVEAATGSLVAGSGSRETALTEAAARTLTNEVKGDAAALWAKLLELYRGGAHTVLGYSSWASYCESEFDMQRDRAYRLIRVASVIDELQISNSDKPLPRNEAVAHELYPVLNDEPERIEEVWTQAVDDYGPEPTAAQVREVVERPATNMAVHYSSTTDEWATPDDFFHLVDREFGFELDVCALPHSAKCEDYFTPEDDGLAQDWTGTCWMNPPYGSEIVAWIKKAYDSSLDGATVACLVPARVDTGWWWDYCRYGEIRFIKGRLKFGGSDTSAPFPSALVVFSPSITPQVVWWEKS